MGKAILSMIEEEVCEVSEACEGSGCNCNDTECMCDAECY